MVRKKSKDSDEIEMSSSSQRRERRDGNRGGDGDGDGIERNQETDSLLPDNSAMIIKTSSLPLEIFSYLHYHYSILFFILNVALFAYKAVRYYYPGRFLGWEYTTIFLYIFIEQVRLMLVSKANKTGSIRTLIHSYVLLCPIIVLHVYYITLQTYVFRVDIVINSIAFFFIGCEIFFSLLVLINLIINSRKY